MIESAARLAEPIFFQEIDMKKGVLLLSIFTVAFLNSASADFIKQDCRKENGGNPRTFLLELYVGSESIEGLPNHYIPQVVTVGHVGCLVSFRPFSGKVGYLVGKPIFAQQSSNGTKLILDGPQVLMMYDRTTETYQRVGEVVSLPGEFESAGSSRSFTVVLDSDVTVKKSMRWGILGYNPISDFDWEATTREFELTFKRNGVKHRVYFSENYRD